MLTPIYRSKPSSNGLSALRTTPASSGNKENAVPTGLHGSLCGVHDPEPEQPTQQHQQDEPFDYNGAYVEYIEPTTGERIRIPHAIVMKYNKHPVPATPSPTIAATAAPATFLQNMLGCFMPLVENLHSPPDTPTTSMRQMTVTERIAEAADDGSDDKMDIKGMHQTGHMPMGSKVAGIKAIASETIKENKTDLKPGTVSDWAQWSLPLLLQHTPNLAKVIDMPYDQFIIACENNPIIKEEDKAFALTLSAALVSTSVHVTNFKKELMKTDITATSSGYKLKHAIISSEHCGRGIFRMARIEKFNDKNFFPLDKMDSTENIVAAANTALAEFKLLPESERCKPNADIKMLLSKMPPAIGAEVAEYNKKIKKREARDLSLKWTCTMSS